MPRLRLVKNWPNEVIKDFVEKNGGCPVPLQDIMLLPTGAEVTPSGGMMAAPLDREKKLRKQLKYLTAKFKILDGDRALVAAALNACPKWGMVHPDAEGLHDDRALAGFMKGGRLSLDHTRVISFPVARYDPTPRTAHEARVALEVMTYEVTAEVNRVEAELFSIAPYLRQLRAEGRF